MIEPNIEDKANRHNIPLSSLFYLMLFVLIGMAVAGAASLFFWNLSDIDITAVLSGEPIQDNKRNAFRIGLMINHVGTFLIPGLLFCLLILKNRARQFLKLKSSISINQTILWSILIFASYPIIGKFAEWNMAIPLPEWMQSAQTDSFTLVSQTLQMNSIGELVISILLVGAAAAIGEELIFRGIIQSTLETAISNPHIAILLSAIIFGGFHMQFERILPLAFLGLLLGYSYYFTKSLWMPILLHFLNNSIQVFSIYVLSKSGNVPDITQIPDTPIYLFLTSLLLTAFLFVVARNSAHKANEARS